MAQDGTDPGLEAGPVTLFDFLRLMLVLVPPCVIVGALRARGGGVLQYFFGVTAALVVGLLIAWINLKSHILLLELMSSRPERLRVGLALSFLLFTLAFLVVAFALGFGLAGILARHRG